MFTGIVEDVGTVVSATPRGDAVDLTIRTLLAAGLEIGASVSVDGVCQTVVGREPASFRVTAVATTLSRTTLGLYREGSRVNLERGLAFGARMDGHLVQGHVDGVGRLARRDQGGEHVLLDVELPPGVWSHTILHGSITLNGVSLTVNALEAPALCQVAIIPHTLAHTNLGELEVGALLNVEGDLIGKYVGRLLAPHAGASPPGLAPGRAGIAAEEEE